MARRTWITALWVVAFAPAAALGQTTETPSAPAATTEKNTPPAAPAQSAATTAPSPTAAESPSAAPPPAAPPQQPAAQQPAPAQAAPTPPGTSSETNPNNPPPDQTRPPAHYYVVPAEPGPSTNDQARVYEPPPPGPVFIVEPPPPPPQPRHRAPKTAFWTGARLGWFVPFGTLWHDGFASGNLCCASRRRTWSDYAAPGPAFEIDAGARLGRHYNVFAIWEHAFLAPGGLDEDSFGGQKYGSTNFYGVGLRFSSDPDDIGFLVEIALGYRKFTAQWESDAELELSDGFFDARIGLGADIRLSGALSLSPMIKLGSGTFSEATWKTTEGSGSALGQLDESGQYGTLMFEMGAHFDLY